MKIQRYLYALALITIMVSVAEFMDEKEIIFPEMAALTIGMWVVDKQVWHTSRLRTIFLLTICAFAGTCIVRYSPFPLLINIAIAFCFAAINLLLTRTTLIPIISACMLPILLGANSWIYPIAVLSLTLLLTGGQYLMEKQGLRPTIAFIPIEKRWPQDALKWLALLSTLLTVAALPIYTRYVYCILPPLIVTFVEFSNPKAGFRQAPVLVFLLLTVAAGLGAGLQFCLHEYWGLPAGLVALLTCTLLFLLFERSQRLFAPAGAIALIPQIIPPSDLIWFPLQVAIGSALFISVAMFLFRSPARSLTPEIKIQQSEEKK